MGRAGEDRDVGARDGARRATDPAERDGGAAPDAAALVARRARLRVVLRGLVLALWVGLLVALWAGARGAGVGPLAYLLAGIDRAASHPWAPLGLLLLYALRPLTLVPITAMNLASGFLLGLLPGLGLALAGTLLSASVGYAIGRLLGPARAADALAERWPLVRTLRRHGFEGVVLGGLMYLHADAVNLPAGLLRIRFPSFLAGIALGNALTLTAAVLTGASVEGRLADATVRVSPVHLVLAAALFLGGLVVAHRVRARVPRRD